jgi:hypothetical protein
VDNAVAVPIVEIGQSTQWKGSRDVADIWSMGVGLRTADYEIRLHHADGRLSIVMLTSTVGDADAKAQALRMLKDGIANAHIWRDGKLVDSVYGLNS